MGNILDVFHQDLSPEHPSDELQAIVEGPKPGCNDRIIARVGSQYFEVPIPGGRPVGSTLTIRCVGDTKRHDLRRADFPLAYMVVTNGKIEICLAK